MDHGRINYDDKRHGLGPNHENEDVITYDGESVDCGSIVKMKVSIVDHDDVDSHQSELVSGCNF